MAEYLKLNIIELLSFMNFKDKFKNADQVLIELMNFSKNSVFRRGGLFVTEIPITYNQYSEIRMSFFNNKYLNLKYEIFPEFIQLIFSDFSIVLSIESIKKVDDFCKPFLNNGDILYKYIETYQHPLINKIISDRSGNNKSC